MKTMLRLTLALALAGLAAPAFAQVLTVTGSFNVTANVNKTCQIQNVGPTLAFGTYDPWATYAPANGLTASTTFQFRCNNKLPYDIAIDKGLNEGGTGSRRMIGATDATQFLSYQLFQDAARTTAWGSTSGTNTLAGAGTGNAWTTLTIHGYVPAAQDVAAQNYADNTVTVTITY